MAYNRGSILSNMPPVTKNLLIINVLMWLATMVFGSCNIIDLQQYLGLHFWLGSDFNPAQLVTYMFMHDSTSFSSGISHIFFNMFSLWMFGRIIEQTWGGRKYLAFFLVCGIGAGITQEIWQFGQYYIEGLHNYAIVDLGPDGAVPMSQYLNLWTTVGASGACYGVMLAFGMTYPNEVLVMFPIPIPLKAKYFVMFAIVIELVSSFATNGNVAHFAHLGGMAFGWFFIRRERRRQRYFGGWDSYTPQRESFLKRMRDKMAQKHSAPRDINHADHDYNARQAEKQREIDRILDKIRTSGYQSLTDEEKRKLFDAGEK